MRAVVEINPPVTAIIRGSKRSQRSPMTGPKIPVQPYAREPTQAVKKKNHRFSESNGSGDNKYTR